MTLVKKRSYNRWVKIASGFRQNKQISLKPVKTGCDIYPTIRLDERFLKRVMLVNRYTFLLTRKRKQWALVCTFMHSFQSLPRVF